MVSISSDENERSSSLSWSLLENVSEISSFLAFDLDLEFKFGFPTLIGLMFDIL